MAYDDMSVFLLMDANGTVCVHMRSNGFIAVSVAAEDRVIYFSARTEYTLFELNMPNPYRRKQVGFLDCHVNGRK